MQVFVTGMGIVSGAGKGVEENRLSLKNEISGIRKISNLANIEVEVLAGMVMESNESLKALLGVDPELRLSRTSLLGATAAREALSALPRSLIPTLPFITSTTIGGMDISESYYRDYILNNHSSNIKYLINHDCGDSSEKIAALLGMKSSITTISTACSSSANAIMLAGRLLRSGRQKRALAGGSDALTHFTLNGFHSLMIYDKEPCKPFDAGRAGLNLGEGAAFLLLENEDSLNETGNTPLAILAGWGNANDAYHQTASSPEGAGAAAAMQFALECAKMPATSVHYVNAHGTGTPNNDLSESKALMKIFGKSVPPFSSTKSFTGHTLAAAGAIETVYSVFSLLHGALMPNLHFQNEIEETGLKPVTRYEEGHHLQFVMSNSFGFGGNNTSLLFQKA